MCMLCTLSSNQVSAKMRVAIREFYQRLSASVSSTKDGGYLAQFYIRLLRDTADEIENNVKSAQTVAEVMVGIDKELSVKKLKVEALLLGKESEFYQNYGMVMPESVRTKVKAELWDSLEKEQANDRTE